MESPEQLEERLFTEALAVAPAGRDRFLDEACRGNPALRERLEALLLAHESAGMFMAPRESPMGDRPQLPLQGIGDEQGKRIGRYKLLQKLGEGGCGVVWMAEQQEPVRRRVALKVIKLGMDTKNVIARFEAERQALALMDHPNIARVLDAGSTESGRPYFVMELVPGIPITKYCDQHNLSTTARLVLFGQVCYAIQHAHQKGIIHRDLKPSNILVTLNDGEPMPKVIDFGIAKATQGRLTDQTLFTAFEQFIGTPAYMSPEQAEMSGIDIDTRSDIYSLGVLLYELLTGRPPFDPKSLLQAGLDEIRRIIREVEPLRPSTRLNTLADGDRDTIARQRGLAYTQLSVILRGDLDWIVMKALEKNRNRRYETASGFALDIQRHLQNEPVSARPPTTAYKISRFVRRNRFTVTAVASVAFALIAGTVASMNQAARAKRAEHVANLERRKALEERARAEDLLGFMLGDLRTQVAKVGRLDVLESVGDKATTYFSARKAEGMEDPDLVRYAKALTQIGEIRMDQARYTEAAAAFSEAYNYTSALVARHPNNGDMLFERGQAEYWNGFVHWKRGELKATYDWFIRYRDTSLTLIALDSSRKDWQSELAYSQQNIATLTLEKDEFDAARADFVAELATLEKLLDADPNDSDLIFRISDVHSWLGGLAEKQGEFAEAIKEYSIQITKLEQLAKSSSAAASWRFKLADALLYQTDMAMVTAQYPTAQEWLKKSQKLLTELTALDPANRRWEVTLLDARMKEASLLKQAGNLAGALSEADGVLSRFEKIISDEPSDQVFARWLAKALTLNAQIRANLKEDSASAMADRAIDSGEKLLGGNPMNKRLVGEHADALVVAGEIARQKGNATLARKHWLRALDLLSPLVGTTHDWRLLDPAVRSMLLLDRPAEAQALLERLNEIHYVPLEPWPDAQKSLIPPQQPK